MTCPHHKIVRIKKDNGIQPTLDEDHQYIFGNCVECGMTFDIGVVRNGKEYLYEPVCSRCGEPVGDSEHKTCLGNPLCDECWGDYSAECFQDRMAAEGERLCHES